MDGQIGLEESPKQYISHLVEVFREVRRVLKDDGTLWVNIGDSYAGSGKGAAFYPDNAMKYKQGTNKGIVGVPTLPQGYVPNGCKPMDLIGIPWMLAFALRTDGWYLRQDIIWAKPNPMPESVKDRCTKSHEYLFLLSKSQHYYYDYNAIKEPATKSTLVRLSQDVKSQKGSDRVPGKTNGNMKAVGHIELVPVPSLNCADLYEKRVMRNKRDVWVVTTKPFKGAHFATFPEDLIKPCVLAGSPNDGVILDPFMGAGTVGVVSKKLGRNYIGYELNPDYVNLANNRIKSVV